MLMKNSGSEVYGNIDRRPQKEIIEMRIIRNGNIENEVQDTCLYCGCIYAYNTWDIQIDHGVMGNNSYVMCPCCGNKNYIYNRYTNWQNPLTNTWFNNFKGETKPNE